MIRQLEVDGVPTLLSPTTGPVHAGLAFRVGFADESLPQRGITHLVEHLALHAVANADYHYNGSTGVRHTTFHLQGSTDDLVPFVNQVCASLADLPASRLATEKEILRTEASGRGGGVGEALAVWRYGARGYGSIGYPEWGLDAITIDDLRAWVGRYFTAENAVLWLAADEVPDGVRLTLPHGVRQPLPPVSSALPLRPAYFASGHGAIAWNAVVPHSRATFVFSRVLERCLRRALRQEGGLSYQVSTDWEPLGDGTDLVTAYADALPEKEAAVLGGVVDVLAALRVGRVQPDDLRAVVGQALEDMAQAEQQGHRLPGQALNLLTGVPVQNLEDASAELRAVTPEDVAAAALAAWHDGLLLTPRGIRGDWAGLVAAPVSSDTVVLGREHLGLENPSARLVAGSEGISVLESDGEVATVLFADCAAVLAWPDGGRRLIGNDALSVSVEPLLLAGGTMLPDFVDAHVPASLRIDLPAREPDEIPQARASAPAPTSVAQRVGRVVGAAFLSLAAMVAGFFVIAIGLDLRSGAVSVATDVVGLVVFLAMAGFCGWSARRTLSRSGAG